MKKLVVLITFLLIAYTSQSEEISRALHFDGVNDYVQINDTIGEAHTISFWIHQSTLPGESISGQPVMSFNNHKKSFIAINDYDPDLSGETVLVSIGDRKLFTRQELNAGWNQVTITSDGNYYTRIYINGQPVTTFIDNQVPAIQQINQLTLGANLKAYKFYSGILSELSIWSTSFSTSKTQSTFASIHQSNSKGQLAYFRFDNSPGDSLVDRSGSITGRLMNFGFDNETSDWTGFGAPVGHYQLNLNQTSQDYSLPGAIALKASMLSGNNAIVYRADEVPANLSGISAPLGENNIVFGIFQPDEAGVIRLELDYTAYKFAHYKEEYLAVYFREQSSDYTWQDINASLDTTNNTITVEGYDKKTGEFMLVSNAVPLPVTFSHVSVDAIDNSTRIRWSTQCEINNDFFTIQRRQGNSDWTDLGTVTGAGNSKSKKSYEFIDHDQISTYSSIQYRIQQTDYDGQVSYSNIVEYKNFTIEIDTYPNPATDRLFIRLNERKEMNVQVFHSSGQKMNIDNRQIDEYIMELNVSGWESGIYIVRAQHNGGSFQKSIMVR